MQYLLGLIGILAGGLFFFRSKAQSAEAINQNVETKEAVVKEDESIAQNQGQIDAEKAKIEETKNAATTEENAPISNQDLVNFLNKFKSDNK